MDREEARYRRLTIALSLALGLSAFVTSGHWGWFLVKALLTMALVGHLALNFGRDYVNQRISIEIDGVDEDAVDACVKAVHDALGAYAIVETAPRESGAPLRFTFAQTDSVARVLRAMRRFGPASELVSARTELKFTAQTASARALVEVVGQAPPHAKVLLPGLTTPAEADANGRFRVRLPFAVVREHTRAGVLRGEWRKGHAGDRLEVDIRDVGEASAA